LLKTTIITYESTNIAWLLLDFDYIFTCAFDVALITIIFDHDITNSTLQILVKIQYLLNSMQLIDVKWITVIECLIEFCCQCH